MSEVEKAQSKFLGAFLASLLETQPFPTAAFLDDHAETLRALCANFDSFVSEVQSPLLLSASYAIVSIVSR
jgi:hypothetical protein